MRTSELRGDFAEKVDIGKVRRTNEDRTLALPNRYGDVLLVACDGMGGISKGDLAAALTVETFDEMFKGILEGKADLGMGNIFINEDRKEKYILTDPVFSNYVSVGVSYDSTKSNGKKSYNKLSDLKYKTIGVLEGTIYDNVAIEHIAGCKLKYFSTQDELYKALDDNDVDGVIYDEPLARYKLNKETSFKMIDRLITYDEYGVIFNKDSEFANKLRNEYNTFLNDIRNSGEYDEIDSIWFGNDDSKKYVPYDELPNVNGRVRMCVTAEIGEPFAYIKDDRFVGYDVDMMYRFCKKYGYACYNHSV